MQDASRRRTPRPGTARSLIAKGRLVSALIAVAALSGAAAYEAMAAGADSQSAAPAAASIAASSIDAGKLPDGYRDWPLIAVAQEEGKLNDLRAVLGNDIAIRAAKAGAGETSAYPDGSVIARLAWDHEALAESAAAFGTAQSYVAVHPKNGVQFMIKDARKYAATGGWG
ncbi:MAG TPA: cytochrome P460 family protein, partial [Terriglobales bacterium]|nr:cytochrome P460 family protein [Terriglobales bacterium]